MIKFKELEYRSYGLYSDVAKDTGYTVDQVSTVYDWYLKKTFEDIINKDTVQVNLKGLGKMKFHPGNGMRYLQGYVEQVYSDLTHLEKKPKNEGFIYKSYVKKKYEKLENAVSSYERRFNKVRELGGMHDYVFNKQTEKLKTLTEKIANLYEPVQRICTIESERTEELG